MIGLFLYFVVFSKYDNSGFVVRVNRGRKFDYRFRKIRI